jgi:hypothetical protein
MILSRIQESVAAYRQWLQSVRQHPHVYPWETLQNFQAHWNPDDPDPAAMYDRCLQNSETRRMWQTESWYPKRMMMEFWRFEPRTLRMMFDDLFNETRETEARIGRFLFGCDMLLRDFRRAHPTSVENNHYHGDYRMIALYLALRYPESYASYDFQVFRTALERFGARDLPQENYPARSFKVMRTLMSFLDKDPAVDAALRRHLHPRRHFQGRTLLLAGDFCRFVAEGG